MGQCLTFKVFNDDSDWLGVARSERPSGRVELHARLQTQL